LSHSQAHLQQLHGDRRFRRCPIRRSGVTRRSTGGIVIAAILLKYLPMPARSFALALLLLLCAAPTGRAVEPAGATVVLQLPPSMSPEAVKGLIADLAAKGAQPAEHPADPPPASGPALMTGMKLTAQIWAATKQAMRAVPVLAEAPQVWVQRVEAEGGTRDAAFRFWAIALAGLVAAPLIGLGMRTLFDRRPVIEPRLAPRLRAAFIQLLVATAGLTAFAFLFCTALLPVSMGRPILAETTDRLVWAALQWRLSIVLLTIVLSPRRSDLRLLAIDDGDARVCSRWFAVYMTVAPFNFFLIWLIEQLGFGHEAVFGAAASLGFVITCYKVAMFWATRQPIARAILAATGGEPGPVRRAVAASWHWFFIALALGIFFGAGVEFALGKGAWVARASTATQGIIVALAVVGQASHNLIARACTCDATDIRLTLRRARLHRALSRLADAFLWILGAAWLGETWGLDLVDPAPGTIERLFVRPALEAAATVVAAWILWTALSAVIDEKMPPPAAPGDEDETPGSASRLDTLLPLLRNTLLIGLAVVAVIVALATLGLDIGPLLAGLGVVGIAIGFGAQSLVRDVISGLFFLMEDAFRVGEYIDTGRLRGTVEGMSLRSVRMRHQNGQVHTVPFGQVLSVTNFSRDWSVIKFNLQLVPTADIEMVRKIIKRVGQELLDDPEIGADFIQPLKMQGVIDVLQTALVVRCKFTATPIRPTYLQRRALQRLIEAFNAADIHFAAPNFTMQLASASAG
jgi:moderate conductance mechanosensitive channel